MSDFEENIGKMEERDENMQPANKGKTIHIWSLWKFIL